MKYLIKIDNKLHGYNDPILLRCDIVLQEPKEFTIYRKVEGSITHQYEEYSYEALRAETNNNVATAKVMPVE